MATKLEELLEKLDPAKVFDRTESEVAEAASRFTCTKSVITDFDEFEDLLIRFVHHIDDIALHSTSPTPLHPWFYRERVWEILDEDLGGMGIKAGMDLARTGKDGGLRRVLQIVANGVARAYARNEIYWLVRHFMASIEPEEQRAIAREYTRRYRHVLSPEILEDDGLRIFVSLKQVLEHHPRFIQAIRRVRPDAV